MSNKSYGLNKERQAKSELYASGAMQVNRCRGSFGDFDIIAFFDKYCLLVSIKSTKRRYASFNKELDKLLAVEVPTYCKKSLWIYWSPNKDREKRGWEKIDV